MASLPFADLVSAGIGVGTNWANREILGADAATEIATRSADQDFWSRANGAGPNDRPGAAADAASGPIAERGFFAVLGSSAGIVAAVALAAVALWFILRRR